VQPWGFRPVQHDVKETDLAKTAAPRNEMSAPDKALEATAPVRKKRLSPQERRAEFIRKAALFFADEGFGGGTRDLARKLGVTQPLLYRYFPSKEDLIKEVYRAIYIDRWRPEWDAMLTDRSRPIRERLQTFYESYTDTIFSREWLRIYLFAGLKGIELNRLYVGFVEDRILSRIIAEYRDEAGLPPQIEPAQAELELAWVLHGGIFYYGVRKVIFEAPVMEQKSRFIANALDVFLEGISRVFATGVKSRTTQARRYIATPGQ
jgi:AcrR family transcriptional regulator